MKISVTKTLRRACLALLCALAYPASGAAASLCHATLQDAIAVSELGSASLEWDCSGTEPPTGRGRIAVQFQLAAPTSPPPKWLVAPVGRFQDLEIVATSQNGNPLVERHASDELLSAQVESLFVAPLPARTDPAVPVYAVFHGLEFPQTALEARLSQGHPAGEPQAARTIALISLICGFLLVPILLNIAYFRVLPRTFLFWHSAMALAFAIHFAASGPLATAFILTVFDLVLLREGSFAMAIIAGLMFIATFMEPGKLESGTIRLLKFATLWVATLFALKVGLLDIARSHVMRIYFVGYLPVLGLCLFASLQAYRRGSRAAKFQLVGWLPFLLLALLRIFTMAAGVAVYVEASWAARIAVTFEIFVTTLGIADRFIVIKRQGDLARAEAQALDRLSKHDPLTGLLNRRAVDRDAGEFLVKGFATFALLDLDHFKLINDEFGHQTGDEVLKAVAAAIDTGCDDSVALRLGGEEFLVLMRGPRSTQRLEAMRQSITVRVAQLVESLTVPVTASMGIIEVHDECWRSVDFTMIYARADALLYEAKDGGRNRSVSDRIVPFDVDKKPGLTAMSKAVMRAG